MPTIKTFELTVPCFLFLFVFSTLVGEGHTAWEISTIALPENSGSYDTKGKYASLGLDSQGSAHISYMKQMPTESGGYTWNLYYISNATGTWLETYLANSIVSNSGNFASLTVDKNDKAHISFMYQNPGDYIPPYSVYLYEASNASGSWKAVWAGSWSIMGNFTNNWTAIKTDPLGAVHIGHLAPYYVSFGTVTDSDLMVAAAADAGGPFQRTTADESDNAGSDLALAIDSQRRIHISYYDAANGRLKYATNETGVWMASTIDSASQVGKHTSIGVDSNDKVHISYYDSTNKDLKYATNAGGSWALSTVDGAGQVGQYTSLAVDAQDKIHIAYYDAGGGNLKYATNSGGTWVASEVDGNDQVGLYASLAVDLEGLVHIGYYDSTNRSLKYAVGTPDSHYRVFLPLGMTPQK